MSLLSLEFNQARKVEGGFIEAAAYGLESAFHCCIYDAFFTKGISAGCFAGSGEELADSF